MHRHLQKLLNFTRNRTSHKIGLYLVAAIVVVIVYTVTTPPDEEVSVSRLGGISLPEDTLQGGRPVTEEYRDALKQADIQRIDEARSKGSSALPTIVNSNDSHLGLPKLIEKNKRATHPKENKAVEAEKPAESVPIPDTTSNVEITKPSIIDPEKVRLLTRYIESLPLRKSYPVSVNIFMHNGMEDRQHLQTDGQSVSKTELNGIESRELPPAGTVLFGHLVGRTSSESPRVVLAEILHGKYSGARLIGRFETASNSTSIQFTRMTFDLDSNASVADATVSINAVAVDTKHIGTAIPTHVDRHVVQNLATGFISGFASGLGKALTHMGRTSTVNSDGSVTTAIEKLNLGSSLLSASGQAAASTGAILSDAFGNRPPTFVVEAGTPIGILFL